MHKSFECPEKPEHNQYWYSHRTVDALVSEMEGTDPDRIAFLSTPSLFCEAVRRGLDGILFEYDEAFKDLAGARFVKYDFNAPEMIAESVGEFDFFVIDPPFISESVISSYAKTFNMLRSPHKSVRILFTTIDENQAILRHLFDDIMHSVPFKPSIPNLIYQYSLFINYEPSGDSPFHFPNTELSDEA